MTRKSRDTANEHVQVLNPGGPREVRLAPRGFAHGLPPGVDDESLVEQPPMVDGAPIVADATARNKPIADKDVPPPVRKFQIVKGGSALVKGSASGGYRATIREGKEIDTANFDIRDLQKQGIRVKEITETAKDLPLVDI